MQLLYITIVSINFALVIGETYNDVLTLRTALLSNYSKDIRPVIDQSDTLVINISGILYTLPEVDVVSGSITMAVAVHCNWYDEKIKWDPALFNNTQTILFFQTDVWIPTVVLGKPVEFENMGKSWMNVHYDSSGLATWIPGNVMRSSCKFNIKFWPFDKQICDVNLIVASFYMNHYDVRISDRGFDTDLYVAHGDWILEDSEAFVGVRNGMPEAVFRLKLKRQSELHVLMIILPLLGIEAISCLVFLLPQDTGDRISYSTTIMLSVTVFMVVVGDNIPKTSDPIPLLVVLIGLALALSVVTIIVVICNMAIYQRKENETEILYFYQALVRLTDNKCWKNARKIESDNVVSLNELLEEEGFQRKIPDRANSREPQLSKYRNNEMQGCTFENTVSDNNSVKGEELTWKKVSEAVDKLALILFVCLHLVIFSTFVVYLVTASDYDDPE